MKNFYQKRMKMAVAIVAMLTGVSGYCAPTQPVGLSADVKGTKVTLAWQNGDLGAELATNGFENDDFPSEGWSTKVTNDYNYVCSWFQYPSDEFLNMSNYEDYIHSGKKSAMVYFDRYQNKGDHETAQDEWLITNAVNGGDYLEFYYYIDPEILVYGAEEGFPDHYYVKVSHDGGETWTAIWDAPKDASSNNGWNYAQLPISGEGDVKVAFQAYSDEAKTVHFLWAIDDVKILDSKQGTDVVDGYTIKLDGEIVAEHVKNIEYVDLSDKEPGNHVYQVYAESNGTLSEPVEVSVEIQEIEFLAPKNVNVEVSVDEYDETSYNVLVTWDAPEGNLAPAYYNAYCDGDQIGWELTDCELEYWGYTKGIYEFTVTAVYENPDGESEPVGSRVAIETRFNAHNLTGEAADGNVTLRWDAPEESDYKMSHYEIWRNEKCIAERVEATEYVDANLVAGDYRYYVYAIYEDGEKTIPVYVDVANGEAAPRDLPLVEGFNSGYLPQGWTIDTLLDITPEYLLWQFDDPNELNIEGEGFDGGYASVDCVNSFYYEVEGALVTPLLNIEGLDPEKLEISFTYDYPTYQEDHSAAVELLFDDSEDWEEFAVLEAYDADPYEETCEPKKFSQTLDIVPIDVKTMRVRWNYYAVMDGHLAIDNVKISMLGSDSVDLNTLNNMSVSNTTDGFVVKSSLGIEEVGVWSSDGRMLAKVAANGAENVKVSVDYEGVCVVKVVTAEGTRTFKQAR